MKPVLKRRKRRKSNKFDWQTHVLEWSYCKPLVVDWGPDEIAENQRSFERCVELLEEHLKRDHA